ncbi:hypothetical protein FLONG3_2604 [Fusarium longipes]|uniref:Uncharacterized protein n=1 Tax=Fusarium longipes TaxID=694270 RepID=A0A395T3G7_9HYPO|nr:hypothetical protein FLONG3_2604 [Fusarium longipes]
MPAATTSEESDYSALHLLAVNPPVSNQSSSPDQPRTSRDIDDEAPPITHHHINESIIGSNNECQLDDVAEQSRETGLLTCKRSASSVSKAHDKEEGVFGNRRENIFWIWKIEILLLFVAAGLLVTIYLILNGYDEQELPDWYNIGITLNTLISIIATFFRAILALIAFEVIAQLKWDWISQDFRPMQQVQLFDSASRGLVGALRLLPVMFQDPLALGAIVFVLLSLGVGSFTQQSIQTYQCRQQIQSSNHPATITVANRVEYYSILQKQNSSMEPQIKIKLAMKDAILSSREFGTLFDCSSGNCTFPTYTNAGGYSKMNRTSLATLGLCSRCSDLKYLMQGPEPLKLNTATSPNNWTAVYSLPGLPGVNNGKRMEIVLLESLSNESLVLNVRTENDIGWARRALSREFLNRSRWSVANITFLGVAQDGCERLIDGPLYCHHKCKENDPSSSICRYMDDLNKWHKPSKGTAILCTLYPCIKYTQAEIKGARMHERLVWDVPLRKQATYGPSWKGIMQPCLVNGTLYTSANASWPLSKIPNPTSVEFHKEEWASESVDSESGYEEVTVPADCIANFDVFEGFRTEFLNTYNNTTCASGEPGFRCVQSEDGRSTESHLGTLFENKTISVKGIEEAMDSIATRLTNEFRQVGKGAFENPLPKVEGVMWETRACVTIAWKWLIFPSVLLILCAILLVAIMIKDAKKKHVWKSSILPFMLKDHPRARGLGMKGMDEVASGLEIKITPEKT